MSASLFHLFFGLQSISLVEFVVFKFLWLLTFREIQFVVLSNIATISIKRKGMFEPYLKSFYVRSNDPTQVKLLKVRMT